MSATGRTDEADWLADRVDASEKPFCWGELVVTSNGDGTYDLRHADDADSPAADLETYHDPTEARGIAKFDSDGGYRPLKGERSLRGGWVFPSLDADDLAEAVDRLYPTSLADRILHDDGRLEVVDYEDVAGRQTGMYSDTDELDGERLEAAVEAFCGDCVRGREWDAGDGADLDAGSEGYFPCPEACSMLISGAREFVGYDDDPVTLELGRGEVEALLGGLDALDRRDLPRRGEVEDGGNRFVARYLRRRLSDARLDTEAEHE